MNIFKGVERAGRRHVTICAVDLACILSILFVSVPIGCGFAGPCHGLIRCLRVGGILGFDCLIRRGPLGPGGRCRIHVRCSRLVDGLRLAYRVVNDVELDVDLLATSWLMVA